MGDSHLSAVWNVNGSVFVHTTDEYEYVPAGQDEGHRPRGHELLVRVDQAGLETTSSLGLGMEVTNQICGR